MKILFFGRLGEVIGREIEVELPSDRRTVAELRLWLADRFPQARDELVKPALRALVDDSIVGEHFVIDAAAAVEFFPPLSGG